MEGSGGPGSEVGSGASCGRPEPSPSVPGPQLLVHTMQMPAAPFMACWEGLNESVCLEQCFAPKGSVSVSQSLKTGLLKSFTQTIILINVYREAQLLPCRDFSSVPFSLELFCVHCCVVCVSYVFLTLLR